MLNEIATDLHNLLARNKTRKQSDPSNDSSEGDVDILSMLRHGEDLLGQVTSDDPNWLVPPPIPPYGKV